MKKLFCLILVIFLMTLIAVPCFAESVELEEETVIEPETEKITLGERLNEFWNRYTAEIITGGGIATTLGLVFFLWKKIKPMLNGLIISDTEATGVRNNQSKAINSLIDGIGKVDKRITALEEKVNTLSTKNDHVTEHFKEVQRSLADLAKLLDTVYSHSKALSQGTKDLVHTYCADCIKIAEHEINGDAEVMGDVETK